MINKRLKNAIIKAKTPAKNIKFSLGAAVLTLYCLMLIITASFVSFKPNAAVFTAGFFSFLNIDYVPQVPAVIFSGALLGRAFGTLAVFLYVILGLTSFAPVFAFGGGPDYIFQYTFGYIAAFIPAAYYTAKELKTGSSFIHIILAVLYGVFIIHITGIIYMIIIAFIKNNSQSYIYDLVFYSSLAKIIYDLIFSFAAVILAKILRKFIWLAV